MAYDGFQKSSSPYNHLNNMSQTNPNDYRPSSSYNPPYPSNHGPDQVNMPQAQVPPPASPQSHYPEPPAQQNIYNQQVPTGNINEAVNWAFHRADNPNYLSPDIVSQITATVIQQLKATGLDNIQGQQLQQPQQLPQQQSAPPPPQWTPPQPASLYNELESPQSVVPPRTSPQTPNIVTENVDYQLYPSPGAYASSPRTDSRPTSARRESPFSQTSDNSRKVESRPRPPSRNETITEMTTLEKVWGKLFEDGKPTDRLGQFLRGIAVHLIENYPPRNTIVVLPDKLQKFYKDTEPSSDPYPWEDIFDDKTSNISRLFREIEAEHHLVQLKLNERPDTPGLTPKGFQRWATLMIQVHPEREYERLQKAVLNMPISNPDDKKERFPKQIPRKLFPEVPDLSLRGEFEKSIEKHCGVDLPPITDEEIVKVAAHRGKAPTRSATPAAATSAAETSPLANERGRQRYSTSSSAIVDDEEGEATARPIERERKPYTAQPGGGKLFSGPGTPTHRHTYSFSSMGSRPSPSGYRPSDVSNQDPYPRTGSSGSQRPITTTIRPRSLSRGKGVNDYRHSEGDLLSHNPSARYSGISSGGDHYQMPPIVQDAEDQRLYESLREREKEREKSKYNDHLSHRNSWASDEEYYRGSPSGQGSGPAGSGSGGYDRYW